MDERAATVVRPQTTATEPIVKILEATIPRYLRALRRAVERAEGPDRLTMQQIRCLQAIEASPHGETLTSRLARQMSVSAPSISSMIDGLVERSLVTRLPDPVNRRQIRLVMTDAGRELLRWYDALVEAHLDRLLAPLTVRARRRLYQAVFDLSGLLDTLEAAEELAAAD